MAEGVDAESSQAAERLLLLGSAIYSLTILRVWRAFAYIPLIISSIRLHGTCSDKRSHLDTSCSGHLQRTASLVRPRSSRVCGHDFASQSNGLIRTQQPCQRSFHV